MEEKVDHVMNYLQALEQEMQHYAKLMPGEQVHTLYFGGGTPNLLGAERLIQMIEMAEKSFDLEHLAELSFEFNPYPEEEIYDIIRKIQSRYGKKYPRIRFSFGIQSFDNEVLQLSGRKTLFLGLVEFLRGLQPLKTENTVFNFDFIAFGKWNQSKKGNRYLRNQSALEFFDRLVQSQFADSFSLYTLELFENQMRKRKNEKLISGEYFGTDEDIYEEFSLLKSILLDWGYARYELSNFSLAGKSSIHNRRYRERGDYLGLGLNAASHLNANKLTPELRQLLKLAPDADIAGIRFKNTPNFESYCAGKYLDPLAFEPLTQKDALIEEFFLSLRTDRGVKQLSRFESILASNAKSKLALYEEQGLLLQDGDAIVLTDEGMDVFNAIVTDIMQEI